MATISKKPNKAKTPEAKQDDFINQAGSNLAEGEVKKTKQKKAQIPVIIPPLLLEEMDKYIESTMTGLSRSSWICQAIKEKLDRDNA
ncbi:hypothetical protein DOJK_00960 [Patescibacteria group bacterium]|nr:hypothetical protein DOJK_00960 [Patescibacteria group bacterium]